jgi:hypothetical protein
MNLSQAEAQKHSFHIKIQTMNLSQAEAHISHKDSDYESVTIRSTHKFTQSDQLLRISKWTVAISILKSIVFEFVSMDSILYDIIEQVSL